MHDEWDKHSASAITFLLDFYRYFVNKNLATEVRDITD
jgi:hypothetical protein